VIGILADDFKRLLADNASALAADVQVFPAAAYRGFDFITQFIAGIEAVIDWRVATDAKPSVRVKLISGYVLHKRKLRSLFITAETEGRRTGPLSVDTPCLSPVEIVSQTA
jgi:hypothetical protein